MSKRLSTIKVSGSDYAKVAERLKEFRTTNPESKHESSYEITDGGNVVFTVWLWRDKADLIELMKSGIADKEVLRSSADANGTAKSAKKGDKDFEKLETIALGRALANLGFLASGEIASFEEMDEFNEFRNQKAAEYKAEVIEKINGSKSLDELKLAFQSSGELMLDDDVVKAKDDMKARLNEKN